MLPSGEMQRVVEHSPQLPQGFTPVSNVTFWPGVHLVLSLLARTFQASAQHCCRLTSALRSHRTCSQPESKGWSVAHASA